MGAIPTVCVFRPLTNTELADTPPPKTEEMIPVFARLYDACMEQGFPIGCAPNVNVSLVMLPEDSYGLSEKSYPWQNLKLKALKKMFGWQLNRRMAAKDRKREGFAA